MIRIPRIAVVGLALAIAVLGALGFRDFSRSPFIGIQHHNLVITAIEPASPNCGTGIEPGDRILTVNGIRVRNLNHYVSLVSGNRAREPLPFVLARGDSTFTATVRSVPQPTAHVSGRFSLLLVAVTFLLVGLVVIMKRPDILGTLLCVICFIFSYIITERPIAATPLLHIVGELVYDFLFIFLPAFFLHFFLLFPGRLVERGTRRSWLLRFLYVPPAALSLSTFLVALWRYTASTGAALERCITVLNALTVLYWVLYIIASLAVFIRAYAVSGKVQRVKFRIVIIGVALGIVPITVLMLIKQFQPTGTVPVRYLWPFFLSFMSISFAYAILKHDAFDLGIVARKSLVYAIVLVLVIALYYALVDVFGHEIEGMLGARASVVTLIAFVICALAIVPVRSGIQAIVDRAFYGSRKIFKDEVIAFSRRIQYLVSIEEVSAFVTNEMRTLFSAQSARVFLREEKGNYLVKESDAGGPRMPLTSFPPDTGLISLLKEQRLPLMLEYFDKLWLANNLDRISRELISMAQTSVAVPLIEQDDLLGFVLVGPKASGKPFTRPDAEILELLGERCAAALTNIRLYRDSIAKEKLDEELHLASEIQERLLPVSPPALAGATLAGRIKSSREVGGDFYDFIELGPGSVGIAVADVSGKGIPAALLMTTLEASVRIEALKSKSPAEILRTLSKSLYERSDPEKFATFFYAIYDDENGILHYSNAGAYPPLVISVDGRISRLQRGGVLLGIEQDSTYREGIVKLKQGDLLVIYTDGFIDQENLQGEPFTEQRLTEFLRNNLHLSVEALLEKLFATVIAFGQSNLKDDMTAVLLRRIISAGRP